MTERLERLKSAADALTFPEREELRDYLATKVEGPDREFSQPANELIDKLVELDWEEQLGIADYLRRLHARPPGVLSADDPNFEKIINERVRRMESGEDKGIPGEEVMRRLREKYG